MRSIIRWVEKFIDDITASSLLIHAIMIVAAVASYGNIFNFLSDGHTNQTTARSLAVVLGVSLVVASSRLTKLNLSQWKRNRNLQTVVLIAVATGLVSGLLQTLEYNKHYGLLPSAMLGFGIPLLLEVAPGLTVSLLKGIDAQERTEVLRRNMADRITESIAAALEAIDPNDIRHEVENAARIFTREFVDNVAGEMLYQLRQSNDHTLSILLTETEPVVEHKPKLQKPAKQTKPEPMTQRHEALLQILRNITDPDAINKAELGRKLDVSATQIRKDIVELERSGRLSINGVVKVL